jgi:hypothetical protein
MDEQKYTFLTLAALERIMGDVTKLTAAVAANTQAVTDTQTLVSGLQAQIAAGGSSDSTDQAAIDAATAQIETNTAALEALKSAVSAASGG